MTMKKSQDPSGTTSSVPLTAEYQYRRYDATPRGTLSSSSLSCSLEMEVFGGLDCSTLVCNRSKRSTLRVFVGDLVAPCSGSLLEEEGRFHVWFVRLVRLLGTATWRCQTAHRRTG